MAVILTRQTGPDSKGSPLTNFELDTNFINLKTESESATADATQALANAATAQAAADAAQGTANTALANAATAQSAADAAQADATTGIGDAATAQAAADAAQGTANTALANAATAQSAADAAQGDATQALADAATAQAAADNAGGDATQALADAATAQARADAAHALATTAIANANTAQQAADAAQGDATTALANAATAQGTADTALSTANTALANAATAQGTADTALSTANTALANAATAQSAADAAQGTANTALADAATAQARADAAYSLAESAATDANHDNRANLDSIDQDMATTDEVTFEDVSVKQIHFNTTSGLVPYSEGTVGYDSVNKCLAIFNDQADITWQIGRENLMRVQNGTGSTIINGRAVAVTGVSTVPVVGYATSYDETSNNTVGILTQDIAAGAFGEVTVIGFVNDVDTSLLSAGAVTWLSDDFPATGKLTTTQPVSPAYAVEMGGCLTQHATTGVLYSRMVPRGNKEGLVDFYNGAILEDHSVTVTSDGATVILTLDDKDSRGYLSLLHHGDFHKVVTPATVTLNAGTDEAPVLNYVYIPESTHLLTADVAIDWPVAEQITPIATVLVQTPVDVQAEGAYKVHAWTDHITGTVGQGHLTHINRWIRKQNATWLDGTAMSFSGGGTATVEGAVTSGHVLQLHQQSFPARLNPMYFHVINDFVTPYIERSNLATILADATGSSLSSRAFSLVFWGVANQDEADCKVMCNLPSGSYPRTSPNLAAADADKFANYGIPEEYKGVGFLIRRVVCAYNVAGTLLTLFEDTYDGDDLRGSIPGTTGGGGGTGTSGNLPAGGADTYVLVKQSAIDYDATWVDPDVIRASVTDSTLSGVGVTADPLSVSLDGTYAQELTAVPRTVHFVYGGSGDGGATPDATTQVSIDALIALSIPLTNIRWIYTA